MAGERDAVKAGWELAAKINLVSAGHRLEVALRAHQTVLAASMCLVGSLDESLAYAEAALSDIKADIRTHHAWYNSPEGQISSGHIAGGSA